MVVAPISYKGYYGLVFLVVGVLLYLLIRFGSDITASNKRLVVRSGDSSASGKAGESTAYLISLVQKVREIEDNTLMVKGLPIRLSELEMICAGATFGLENTNIIHNGMLYTGSTKEPYIEFGARMTYDEFVEHGNFTVRKNDSFSRLLGRNHIVAGIDLALAIMAKNSNNVASVLNFNKEQELILEARKRLFLQGNALLLFLSINGFVRVMTC